MDQNAKNKFLSFKEALALFVGSESTLRRRIEDGSIPVRQFGGKGCQIEISYSVLMEGNQKRKPKHPNKNERSIPNKDKIPGPEPKWRK